MILLLHRSIISRHYLSSSHPSQLPILRLEAEGGFSCLTGEEVPVYAALSGHCGRGTTDVRWGLRWGVTRTSGGLAWCPSVEALGGDACTVEVVVEEGGGGEGEQKMSRRRRLRPRLLCWSSGEGRASSHRAVAGEESPIDVSWLIPHGNMPSRLETCVDRTGGTTHTRWPPTRRL